VQYVVYIFFALGLGAVVSLYMPLISETSRIVGSPLAGNILFFAIALITSIIIFIAIGDTNTLSNMIDVPPVYLIAGVLSAFMILGMSMLMPILGVRQFIILTIAGQILMSVIAGHFGILGLPEDHISSQKIFGVILVLAGVFFSVSK